MSEPALKCQNNDIFKQSYTRKLFISFKISYSCCFGFKGNLELPDFLQDSFITQTRENKIFCDQIREQKIIMASKCPALCHGVLQQEIKAVLAQMVSCRVYVKPQKLCSPCMASFQTCLTIEPIKVFISFISKELQPFAFKVSTVFYAGLHLS